MLLSREACQPTNQNLIGITFSLKSIKSYTTSLSGSNSSKMYRMRWPEASYTNRPVSSNRRLRSRYKKDQRKGVTLAVVFVQQ